LTEVAPGSWQLTVDMAAWVDGQPGFIPDLIADGTIKKAEITLASRLDVDIGRTYRDSTDTEVMANLNAVTQTFDLDADAFVDNYFKGDNATVDETKCEKCHDQLAVTWHTGRGRGGDIMACKNCHNPTYAGSHVEMASRSVENYVHAIHTFQDFDVDDSFHDDAPPDDPAHGEDFDPVLAKRYDQHIQHVFPNFTARNCEACHKSGTYNVPDQSKSMPGLLSAAQTIDNWYEMVSTAGNIPSTIAVLKDERNIGTVPEYVVGPASRACGGCHRARLINRDLAGDLASFNAHTEAGGTFVENDAEDTVLFGVIDKIMSLFE
jgi:OmcA/MtrC family decaheme c-type cytochrome